MAASARDTKVRAMVDLTAALNSLAVTEKGRRRSKVEAIGLAAKIARLEIE